MNVQLPPKEATRSALCWPKVTLFSKATIGVLRQCLLFLHALDNFLFELGEFADFLCQRVFDIFLSQQVETVNAEHLAGSPTRIMLLDGFLQRGSEHLTRYQ